MSASQSVLIRLMSTIDDRKANPSVASYTSRLLDGGVTAIGAKVIEEAAEAVEAAGEDGAEGRSHFVHEAADLIYHLLVLLSHRDVSLPEVEAELASRFGVSGLQEKASRDPAGPSQQKQQKQPKPPEPKR